jgi:hypothetical protein
MNRSTDPCSCWRHPSSLSARPVSALMRVMQRFLLLMRQSTGFFAVAVFD